MPSGKYTQQPNRRNRETLPDRQGGAALIMAAAVIVAMVTMMALAIDLGQVYATKENLDTAANIAALEASRAVAGCNTGGVPADPEAAALAAATLAVERAYSDRLNGNVPAISTILGGKETVNNVRSFTPNASLPEPGPQEQPVTNSAVQVNLSDSGYASFTGAFFKPTLVASASAEAIPAASFRVGSSLLRLKPEFLGPLGIDVSVFDRSNLVDANITLGELATNLNLGTTEALLNTEVTVGEVLVAIDGSPDTSLGSLTVALSNDLSNVAFSLDAVLADSGLLDSNTTVGAEALADAVTQLALAERGQNGIAIPLNINIPDVAGVVVNIRILEPPQIATMVRPGLESSLASSSQILIEIIVNLDVGGGGLLGGLLSGIASIKAEIPLHVRVGHASASLRNIFCASAANLAHTIEIDARTETGSLGLGGFDDISAPNPQPTRPGSIEVSVLGRAVSATVTVGPTSVPLGSQTAEPLMPLYSDPPVDDNIRQISAGLTGDVTDQLIGEAGNLGDIDTQLNVSVLGLGLNVGADVGGIVNGLLTSVLNAVALNDLLEGLGIRLGSAEVELLETRVDQPVLFESS